MSDVHAGPDTHHDGDGLCTWGHHFEDVNLRCDSPAIPLGDYCADHEIERAARRHFAARVVTIGTEDMPA